MLMKLKHYITASKFESRNLRTQMLCRCWVQRLSIGNVSFTKKSLIFLLLWLTLSQTFDIDSDTHSVMLSIIECRRINFCRYIQWLLLARLVNVDIAMKDEVFCDVFINLLYSRQAIQNFAVRVIKLHDRAPQVNSRITATGWGWMLSADPSSPSSQLQVCSKLKD